MHDQMNYKSALRKHLRLDMTNYYETSRLYRGCLFLIKRRCDVNAVLLHRTFVQSNEYLMKLMRYLLSV